MARKILIIGAGRSSSSLIRYLLQKADSEDWTISVGDIDEKLALSKVGNHPKARGFKFDAFDTASRKKEIEAHDLVISMLPAAHHFEVLKDCVELKKHVITPSYVSDKIKT